MRIFWSVAALMSYAAALFSAIYRQQDLYTDLMLLGIICSLFNKQEKE